MATVEELLKRNAMRIWTLTGPNALVKVVEVPRAVRVKGEGKLFGYFTQAKYIDGLSSNQIQRDLGLPPGSGELGMWVFWFSRLPLYEEFDQRYFACFPGGKPWTEAEYEKFNQARKDYLTKPDAFTGSYPPGSPDIPQWEIKKGLTIKTGGMIRSVTSFQPFEAT